MRLHSLAHRRNASYTYSVQYNSYVQRRFVCSVRFAHMRDLNFSFLFILFQNVFMKTSIDCTQSKLLRQKNYFVCCVWCLRHGRISQVWCYDAGHQVFFYCKIQIRLSHRYSTIRNQHAHTHTNEYVHRSISVAYREKIICIRCILFRCMSFHKSSLQQTICNAIVLIRHDRFVILNVTFCSWCYRKGLRSQPVRLTITDKI